MDQQTEAHQSILICPFSGKELHELSERELGLINEKIESGFYFFHHGAPVKTKIDRAYGCSSRSYIYPVFDNILFLKKLTAIVPKNRTQAAIKRISDQEANAFYEEYGLEHARDKRQGSTLDLQSAPLNTEQLRDLSQLLPKKGKSFVSVVTHDVDSIHNLVFGTEFDNYVHLDFSIDRLRSVEGELKPGTLYVLGDWCDLPLKNGAVDAMFSFDYINSYEKEVQKAAYSELKRSMNGAGVSILLYDREKPLHAKSQYTAEKAALKAKRLVTPWKKASIPNIYFYPVGDNQTTDHKNFVVKTSLGSQLS